jgi:flagellar biosynthesis protein FlhF
LEELLPKVRAELGPDAVIVRQREGLTGGVGGFFQKKLVEIEAAPGEPGADPFAAPTTNDGRFSIDVTDDTPATPDFLAELSRAEEAVEEFTPFELPEIVEDDAWSGWRDPIPAPAVTPYVSEQVDGVPTSGEGAWHQGVPRSGEVPGTSVVAAPRAPLPARWPAEATALRDQMVARGVDGPLADAVVEETVTHLVPLRSGAKLKPLLVSALAQRIPVRPIGGMAGRVVAFVGPGGSGKTHCASRLAGAYAAADRMPVRCVSLAPRDAGAELALLLAPAGVPLQTAARGAQAAEQIAGIRDEALVLVDTPGVSPRAKGDLRALHAELRAIGADDVLLTLPATSSAGAARELMAAGKRVGASGVVLTHADETEHLGPAVGAAMEADLPFAYVGQAEALRPAAAEELAGALVGSSRAIPARR